MYTTDQGEYKEFGSYKVFEKKVPLTPLWYAYL